MTLQELRSLVRRRMRDTKHPYLIDDAEIDANLNEAQREACIRANLIESDILLDIATTDTTYNLDSRILDVIGIKTSTGSDFADEWTLTETKFELASAPSADDTLTLRCYLLPQQGMVADTDEPEIRSVYHMQMADWAISLCYLLPDAEVFDEKASQRYEARFIQSFGERPSALTQRNRRSKPAQCIVNNGYI